MSLKNSTIQKEFEEILPELRSSINRYISSRVICKADAEDVTQETIIKVSESLSSFDPKKGNLYQFSLALAYWQIRNFLVKYKRHKLVYNNDLLSFRESEWSALGYNHVRDFESLETFTKVDNLIQSCYKKLPVLNRLIAILHFKKSCSRKEIATITGKSVGYVGGTLHRIKQSIIKEVRSELQITEIK